MKRTLIIAGLAALLVLLFVFSKYANVDRTVSPVNAPTVAVEQGSRETGPLPFVDFPDAAGAGGIKVGPDSVLAEFRVTTGDAIELKGLTVHIDGLPTEGASPLTNVHVTDQRGNDFFGTQSIGIDGTGKATLHFSGSYRLPKNAQMRVQVRADVPVTIPSGTKYTVSFPREGIVFADGNSGQPLPRP